jgi:hypothetical protein
MVIVADSPAWANRLRFSINTLLSQLQQYSNKFHGLTKIEVQVSPHLPETAKSLTIKREISTEAARYIEESAEGIDDPDLKQALQRLAKQKCEKNQ